MWTKAQRGMVDEGTQRIVAYEGVFQTSRLVVIMQNYDDTLEHMNSSKSKSIQTLNGSAFGSFMRVCWRSTASTAHVTHNCFNLLRQVSYQAPTQQPKHFV
jgi:hypothetical protein